MEQQICLFGKEMKRDTKSYCCQGNSKGGGKANQGVPRILELPLKGSKKESTGYQYRIKKIKPPLSPGVEVCFPELGSPSAVENHGGRGRRREEGKPVKGENACGPARGGVNHQRVMNHL